jgi:hypothetical protein
LTLICPWWWILTGSFWKDSMARNEKCVDGNCFSNGAGYQKIIMLLIKYLAKMTLALGFVSAVLIISR